MAFARVAAGTTYESAASTTIVLAKPEGVAAGDFLLALCSSYNAADPSAVPSGWAKLQENIYGDTYKWTLYWKIAGASEGDNYTWAWAGSVKRLGLLVAYRDGFNTSDPIDGSSNTAYTTSNASCQAAEVTAAGATPAIFVGVCYRTSAATFTPPGDFVEDIDYGHTNPDFWATFASRVLSAAGATGAVTATLSASLAPKHAFLVVLKAPAVPGSGSSSPGRAVLRRARERRVRR